MVRTQRGHDGYYLPWLFILSAAGLAFEVTLTRVFALAQWYHFAFMSVSLALLGFGASGSALALPFFFGGLAVGGLLAARPETATRVYAANLAGSAAGCLVALGTLPLLGGSPFLSQSFGGRMAASLCFFKGVEAAAKGALCRLMGL